MKRDYVIRGGVAVDSSLPIVSIEDVPTSDVRWKAAARAVVVNFSRLEAAKARADREPLTPQTPSPVVRIIELYGEAASPDSAMYFIAEKKYHTARSPSDPGCLAKTIVAGWLVPTDTGALTLRNPKPFLTDCDGTEVMTLLPLAAFRVSGRVFWVIQELAYEGQSYGIAEIGPSGVRYPITAYGGGC